MQPPRDSDPLGAFVGLRNMLAIYVITALAVLLAISVCTTARCDEPCRHPEIAVDYQRDGVLGSEWRVFTCEICSTTWTDSLPIVDATQAERREYSLKMDELAARIDLMRRSDIPARRTAVQNGVRYSVPNRTATDSNSYNGATSQGDGWEIRWQGPYNKGPTPQDAARALLNHLTHLQRTNNAASEQNAKMLYRMHQLIEELDGKPPEMGGSLNDLIPKK